MLILLAGAALEFYLVTPRSDQSAANALGPGGPECKGAAACFSDRVTHIVAGATRDLGGARIRLALVNPPEVGRPGYSAAKLFTAETCPVGSKALVDEDDGQTGGSYGRIIAVVHCGSLNLNQELLRSGHA